MTGLTEFWLSRRVQRTAATKVHQPLDPKIAKDGLGSGTVLHFTAMSGGSMSDTGPSCPNGSCALLSRTRSICFNAGSRPKAEVDQRLLLSSPIN